MVVSAAGSGTGATDACLRDIKQAGVILVQSTTGTDVAIDDLEVLEYENFIQIPEFPVRFPGIFYFINWDREGMLHMEEIHTREFYLVVSAPSPSPNLYRRLEKRPYAGNCNLRFL